MGRCRIARDGLQSVQSAPPKYTLDTYLDTNNGMLASKFVTIHVDRTQRNLCCHSACLLLYTIKQVLALSLCKGKLIELKS